MSGERRRKTDIIGVDEDADARRAFGAQELIRVMKGAKPVEGRSLHIISGGNVDMICHIRWLLHHFPHIQRLFLSAWAISAPDIMLLKRWHDHGEIDVISLLVGDVFPSNYKKEWEKLQEFHDSGFLAELYHAPIHSKLMLIDTGKEKVVVEGSANCNMNPRVEQSVVTVSASLYDFYRQYFDDLFSVEDGKEFRRMQRANR